MTQPDAPVPGPGILNIAPYVGGEGRTEGGNSVTKLSSNENPLGPSERAKDAVRAVADTLELYPSGDHIALRRAIGDIHGLDPARLVCGSGSDELISLLCNAYAGPGREVIHTEHGFAMYPISAMASGATPVKVAERNRHADVAAILAALSERTGIVFLANPNNPTGTMIDDDAVQALIAGLPAHVMLVLDGAYAEYVEGFDGGAALVDQHPNVVMTRTFSKIYGLGGLRVGWMYAHEPIIDVMNRMRGPFNVGSTGLAAAEAAMRDQRYVDRCRAENATWRAYLTDELRAMGLSVDDSLANFVLPEFADEATAQAADARLRSHGIIVRAVGGYGLPRHLRISVGDEVACRRVVAILKEFLGQGA